MMHEKIVTSLGESVGKFWQELQHRHARDGEFFISTPLSSTPLPVYKWVIDHAQEFEFWDRVRFVLMDEMIEDGKDTLCYIPVDDAASYESFARKHLIDPLEKITGFAIPIIKPNIEDIANFYTKIDLLLLALGIQGNYANVMPGTPKETGWHIAYLTDEYRNLHTSSDSQSFPAANFRKQGMSLGPRQVLEADHVMIIASGEKKRDLVRQLKEHSSFDAEFPLSIIRERSNDLETDLYVTLDAI